MQARINSAQLCMTLSLLLTLASCASTPQTAQLQREAPTGLAQLAQIDSLPFFPQDRYQCGPAALATVLVHAGVETSPEQLVGQVYVPDLTGSLQAEIKGGIRAHGLLPYQLAPQLTNLLSEVQAGNPVLVLQNLGLSSYPQWHYAVVKGFDRDRHEVILNSGTIEDYRLGFATFERTWRRGDHWAVVATQPGELPATAESRSYFMTLSDSQATALSPEALKLAYEAGLQRWSDDRNLLMGYGNWLLASGSNDQAAAVFTQVVTAHPQYGPGHNNLAMALLALGATSAASDHVHQALAIEDSFTDVYAQTLQQIQKAK